MYSGRNGQKQQAWWCSRRYTRAGCYPMNRQWLTKWMNHGMLAMANHAELSGLRLAMKKKSQH